MSEGSVRSANTASEAEDLGQQETILPGQEEDVEEDYEEVRQGKGDARSQ